MQVTIESYDGAAVVRTIDPRENLIEPLLIAPGCEDLVAALPARLREEEGGLTEAEKADFRDGQ